MKVGRKKRGSVCFFSSAGQIEQEVHVSESGSAETAPERSDKERVKSHVLFLKCTQIKRLKFDLVVTSHRAGTKLNEAV